MKLRDMEVPERGSVEKAESVIRNWKWNDGELVTSLTGYAGNPIICEAGQITPLHRPNLTGKAIETGAAMRLHGDEICQAAGIGTIF